jgi:hypothetical protein
VRSFSACDVATFPSPAAAVTICRFTLFASPPRSLIEGRAPGSSEYTTSSTLSSRGSSDPFHVESRYRAFGSARRVRLTYFAIVGPSSRACALTDP